MDWQRSLSDLREHLPWLSPLVGAGTWLLGKRRGWRPLHSLILVLRPYKALAYCREDLVSCEGSRDNERAAKEYAMVALREITQAAAMVKAAADSDPTITGLSSAPGNSPATSSASSTIPADRPATRSRSD